MKKYKLIQLAILSSILFSIGCGRNYGGTYVGTQNSTLNGMTTSSQLTLTLTHSNELVNISWQDSSGTFTGTGTPTGNTITITNLTGTVQPVPASQNGTGYPPPTPGYSTTCTYGNGTITFSGDNIVSGTIASNNNQTYGQPTTLCPTLKTIVSASKNKN